MRKTLLLAVLALAVFTPGGTLEDSHHAARVDDRAFYERVSDSIVIIEVIGEDGAYKGSGIIITDHIVMTAKHLLQKDSLLPIVYINGFPHLGTKYKVLDNTDAAFIYVDDEITSPPIEWNLETSTDEVQAFAFGAWGSLTKITYSAGTVSREMESITFAGQEIQWTIKGSVMLYFGFSGGALVDASGRLIGVSFGSDGKGTFFVDARPLHKIAFDPNLFSR